MKKELGQTVPMLSFGGDSLLNGLSGNENLIQSVRTNTTNIFRYFNMQDPNFKSLFLFLNAEGKERTDRFPILQSG